jgi:hypothetical protein
MMWCDMIWHDIMWYMVYDILLTAIGLTPSGGSTVHVYTQIIHRTQLTQMIHKQHS